MQKALKDALLSRPGAAPGRDRDHDLVLYIGRHGLVTISLVMEAMEVGRTAAYRRVAACVDAGLLERVEWLRSEPTVLRATREGLKYAGLGLPLAVVPLGEIGHSLHCASTAQALVRHYGHECVLTERELMLAERIEGAPIASAEIGTLPNGAPRLHRPDLVALTDSGTLAVEIELTAKSPRRLAETMRSWKSAGWVKKVHYLCRPGQTRRAVERAIAAAGAASKVEVVGKVQG